MVVGMCLGWGFGAAAMRAALASRDQVLLKQNLQREAQKYFAFFSLCPNLFLMLFQYSGPFEP